MKLIQILLQVEKAIVAGKFTLPALPAIAIQVRKAVRDPLMDLSKLAKLVSLDPSFTAYLINLANSPIYRGVASIDSIPLALGRMGMESTRNSAMLFAIRSLFKTKNQLCKKLLNIVWEQSCRVSALSYVIAKNLKISDPEKASIAGLLHNVGLIPVLMKLVEQGESEQNIIEQWAEISRFSRKISVRVIAFWGLGEEIKAVTKGVGDWSICHKEPLVDLINLAIWHSYLGRTEFKQLPSLQTMGYFKNHSMSELDAGESLMFVKQSNQEIQQMMQALNG